MGKISGWQVIRHNGNFHELFLRTGGIQLGSSYSSSTGYHFATYTCTAPDDSYVKNILTNAQMVWSVNIGNFGGILNAQFVSYNSSNRVITIYIYGMAAFTISQTSYISMRFCAPIGTWPTSYTDIIS